MTIERAPEAGVWYETEEGEVFQVVAIDQSTGTAEIQYADGDVDELELDEWYDMELEEVESPEDWQGSMDASTEEGL